VAYPAYFFTLFFTTSYFFFMKTFRVVMLCSLGALTMSSSCEKESTEPSRDCVRTGYVIGIAPCPPANKTGYILALESPRDTVYTYNLPKEAFTYTPSANFNAQLGEIFTPAVRNSAKVTIGYYLTPKVERDYGICQAQFIHDSFHRMTRDQEVTITCASKRD